MKKEFLYLKTLAQCAVITTAILGMPYLFPLSSGKAEGQIYNAPCEVQVNDPFNTTQTVNRDNNIISFDMDSLGQQATFKRSLEESPYIMEQIPGFVDGYAAQGQVSHLNISTNTVALAAVYHLNAGGSETVLTFDDDVNQTTLELQTNPLIDPENIPTLALLSPQQVALSYQGPENDTYIHKTDVVTYSTETKVIPNLKKPDITTSLDSLLVAGTNGAQTDVHVLNKQTLQETKVITVSALSSGEKPYIFYTASGETVLTQQKSANEFTVVKIKANNTQETSVVKMPSGNIEKITMAIKGEALYFYVLLTGETSARAVAVALDDLTIAPEFSAITFLDGTTPLTDTLNIWAEEDNPNHAAIKAQQSQDVVVFACDIPNIPKPTKPKVNTHTTYLPLILK